MLILTIFAYYLLIGALFGVGFWVCGYRSFAPEAADASRLLRLIWLPAAILLWPLLTVKWYAAARRRATSLSKR